mgnify:CR=1 FL=1
MSSKVAYSGTRPTSGSQNAVLRMADGFFDPCNKSIVNEIAIKLWLSGDQSENGFCDQPILSAPKPPQNGEAKTDYISMGYNLMCIKRY